MLVANVPVVLMGEYLIKHIPLNIARLVASAVFALVGVFHIIG